ncbi:hypothetical protein Tco_1352534 [Tanacetum coccineum]
MESSTASQKFIKLDGVGSCDGVRSWFSSLQPASNSFVSVKELFKVIIQGNVHWVRAKEMEGWDPLLCNSYYASSSSDEENEHENEGSQNGKKYESNKEVNKVSESSCMHGDAFFYDNINNKSKESNVQSEDPFNIYDLLNKNKNKEGDGNSKEDELKYPQVFTPKETFVNEVQEKEMEAPTEEVKQNSYNSVRKHSLNASYCSQRFKACGSIIDLMENFLRWDGECVIMGDFNEVRSEQEMYGSVFNVHSAKDFDKLVKDTWMHLDIADSYGMIQLKKKLQALKIIIKEWTKNAKKCSYKKKSSIQSKLSDIDKIIDQGGMAQKAKVRWAIEGDENTKYFHGILNNKRSQLAIRGVFVNGDWIVEPNDVKSKFLKHFSSQFDRPDTHRICLADEFNNQLSLEQQDDLKRTVSIEEIKRAVWDCGTDKSHGPDIGNSFENEYQLLSRSSSLQLDIRCVRNFVAPFSHWGQGKEAKDEKVNNSCGHVVSKVTYRLSNGN